MGAQPGMTAMANNVFHCLFQHGTHQFRLIMYAHEQVEEHLVDGEMKQLLVHRKGSTRAFPPHHPLIPIDYQLTGQPVLIGGTMGTCSYVLTGEALPAHICSL